jgi:hypothetical protein
LRGIVSYQIIGCHEKILEARCCEKISENLKKGKKEGILES